MKLLFINPPLPTCSNSAQWYLREENHSAYDSTPMPPHFAPAILGYVRQFSKGKIEIKVMDGLLESFSPDDVKNTVKEWGADVVFTLIGLDILQNDASFFTDVSCPVIAQICPVTVDPAEAVKLYDLKIPYFIFGGETEQSLTSALNELAETGTVETSPGILINRQGEPLRKTDWPEMSDMTACPLPAYDLFDMRAYLEKQMACEKRETNWYSALVKTMKGCIFQCIFCTCSSPGQQARYKSSYQVIEELKLLKEEYGFRRFVFIDPEFGVNIKRAKDICQKIIDEKLNIRYLICNRIELVDEELLRLLKASGCEMIRFGIETADLKAMERINKRLDLKKASETIKKTRAIGIPVHVFFIIGLPGEDDETLRLNAEFIINNQADSYSVGRAFLIPNTALYNQVKKEDRLLITDWQQYRKNEAYQFKHDYYKDLKQLKRAERQLLNLINRARLTTYRMGKFNERLFLFLGSFSILSIFLKERAPRFFDFGKRIMKRLLHVQ